MKFRVISDLHLDVNKGYDVNIADKSIFTVVAGDTSGDPAISTKWLLDNIKNGVYVAGNHLVYNDRSMKGVCIQDLKNEMRNASTDSLHFLENDTLEINDILFVGATLYTDYKLNNSPEDVNMWYSEKALNDFRWGFIEDNDGGTRKLRPLDYLKMFNYSFEYIKKVVEDNPNKKIVVVTHHAPSNNCINKAYALSATNASYASSLEQFILDHPNIKCWVYGHTHNPKNFKIGDCVVINNARGYVFYGESRNWTPNVFVDTDTWEVSSSSYSMSKEEKDAIKKSDEATDMLIKAL